jgi:carboxymethylenebutenolidase
VIAKGKCNTGKYIGMSSIPAKKRSHLHEANGPSHAQVWQEHIDQKFVHKDLDGTMRTMADNPEVIHVPVGMGGRGRAAVRRFYAEFCIGRGPRDARWTPVSRTVDAERLVDEMVLSFTHDAEIPWMLPGVAPTEKRVDIPLVVIVAFRNGRIESEHVYWDQASVLAQVGLLDGRERPVLGSAQRHALVDRTRSLNDLAASPRR